MVLVVIRTIQRNIIKASVRKNVQVPSKRSIMSFLGQVSSYKLPGHSCKYVGSHPTASSVRLPEARFATLYP